MSKNSFILAVSAILALVGGVACNKSSEGGMSGTNNSFKISAPTLPPTLPVMLKQGDKQTVTLTLDRGSGFQQTVKLDAQPPKGLKVEFDKSTIKASDAKEVSMSITADKDTALGGHVIKVTAKPDTGAETTLDVNVKISAVK